MASKLKKHRAVGDEEWMSHLSKFQLQQEVSTTEVRPLSKAPNPQLLPRRCTVGCPLLHLDGLNAENTFHSSLYSV